MTQISEDNSIPQLAETHSNEVHSDEVLSFLVRSVPARALWQWLCADEQAELRYRVTRGFRGTAQVLRQPMAQARLISHLKHDQAALSAVLRLWGEAGPPAVLSEVRALPDEATLIEHLPQLRRQHNEPSLTLALLLDERRAALESLQSLRDEETSTSAVDNSEATAAREAKKSAGADLQKTAKQLEKQLEKARAESGKWQARAAASQERATTAETALATARREGQREAQKLGAQIKQAENRAQTLQEQWQETQKVLDRTSRRLKSAQQEVEDGAAQIKRLKRQLRQQQQLNEELRKQLAAAGDKVTIRQGDKVTTQAPASNKSAASVTVSPRHRVTPSLQPLDQPFIWQAEGRQFRITPREIKHAVDRNDENFVFTLIQALDALRETNEKVYRALLDRVREFDRYYARVLTGDTTRVLVDASNVARYDADRSGKGKLQYLLAMRDELRRRDCFPILMIADASLPHFIDEPEELRRLAKSGEVQLTATGQEADEVLAREARRTGAYVVTNDRNFHLKVAPDFDPPRIIFRIYDGVAVLDEF